MEGFLGLIILALDLYAIFQIVGSSASTTAKVGWSALVILLPVVGLLIWMFAGPRGPAAAAA